MKMIPTSIVTAAIVAVFGGPAHHHLYGDPPIPDGALCTNNCPQWSSGPVTNSVGYPVLRLTSIRASHTNVLGTGFTVSTNYGFEITSGNHLTSRYETLTNFNNEKYFHFYVAVINTDPARRYSLLTARPNITDLYFPLDLGWNGLGTNEYQLNGFVSLANEFEGRYFKVKDIGPAE